MDTDRIQRKGHEMRQEKPGPSSLAGRSFDTAEDVVELPKLRSELVRVGELTVGRTIHQPGWKWSEHVKPTIGGDWCQAHHVGVVLTGSLHVITRDGSSMEFGPREVYNIPPGHDAWAAGDEPVEVIEWTGVVSFLRRGPSDRVLATLLFTDIVDSTATAVRLGEAQWREALARHFHGARAQLERYAGREVGTTGDGMLAVFEGPGAALRCAAAIRADSRDTGLEVRIGVHVGEVEVVGTDVRGVAVHEAARVMGAAGAGEILTSAAARMLASRSDLTFEDRGLHEMKGLPEPMQLFAFLDG